MGIYILIKSTLVGYTSAMKDVPLRKESWLDPTEKAQHVLDFVMNDADADTAQKEHDESLALIQEELRGEKLVQFQSNRAKSRVLFITKDTSILEENSASLLHFKNIASVFDEIHIMLLTENSSKRIAEAKRLGEKMWLYQLPKTNYLFLTQAVLDLAKVQLEFGGGFRPDVIVALGPFESSLAGIALAETYDRPLQVHILEDFFKLDEKENKTLLKIAKSVLKKVSSVRVSTESLKEKISKKFPKIDDVGLLPKHYDIKSLLELRRGRAIQEAYPQFVFHILYVGDLDHRSTLFRAIDASRASLISPKIGFVVLGDGPYKKEFVERAQLLSLTEKIKFQPDMKQLLPYLLSADILICPDTTAESEEIVFKAAAAGLPILAAKTEIREDLFEDGESAFLCDEEDTIAFSQKLSTFLNGNTIRTQFSRNAQDIVKSRLHDDPEIYRISYRDSIESVFGGEEPVHPVSEEAKNNTMQGLQGNVQPA